MYEYLVKKEVSEKMGIKLADVKISFVQDIHFTCEEELEKKFNLNDPRLEFIFKKIGNEFITIKNFVK